MRALFLGNMQVYLDNSATTRPRQQAVKAALEAMESSYGNPSTLYRLGLDAEKIVKAARKAVAASLGALPEEIFFTSGGTESNNTAVFGAWESRKKQGKRVITTAVEHPSVLNCFEELKRRGADVVILPVGRDGSLDLDAFRAALTEETVLVSVMQVNNETGAIFPVREIGRIIKEFAAQKGIAKPLLHTDCVQSYGKLQFKAADLGADLISVSAHKVHGLKGTGALYIKKGVHIQPFMLGGGQESGFRSGTENVPGIAAFGAAAGLLRISDFAAREHLKKRLTEEIPDIRINSPEDGCPSVLNVSFLGCRAEVLLHMLEQDGIYVSTGSACSSKDKGSRVLRAMGLSAEEIEGAVRFSFCADNTVEETDYVVERLKAHTEGQRRLRSAFRRK